MNVIINWFNGLEPTLRVYWGIAIFASVVFIIQMVLTFIGIGDTDGGDFDVDGGFDTDGNGDTMDTGGAIQLFTVRNFVNFFLGIGWGGVCFSSTIKSPTLLAIVALITGCVFVGIFIVMFRQLMRLEHNGSFNIREAVGQVADVYLRIPAQRSGEGKVQFSFHGSVQELPAITDGEQVSSGAKVRVLEVIGNHTLLVEKV